MKTITLRLVVDDGVAENEAEYIERFAGTSSGTIIQCVTRPSAKSEVKAYRKDHDPRYQ